MFISSPKELALAFARQRKKLGLSQAQVGELVGLKQTTISAFENNPAGTKLETLFRILSVLYLDMQISAKESSGFNKKVWQEEW